MHYLGHWIRDLEEYSPDAKKILVGNKKDLECQISSETIELFKNANDCSHSVHVSAKTGEGIQDTFNTIAHMLVEQVREKSPTGSTLELESAPERKNGCCS